jgi:DNA-binding NarL/FixJ family response regulator
MRYENAAPVVAPQNQLGSLARHWSFAAVPEVGHARRHGADLRSGASAAGAHAEGREVSPATNILIIDDYALYRDNLAATLAATGSASTSVAWDLESLCVALESHRPDVILVNMATRQSVSLLRQVFDVYPGARVIALGISEDDESQIVACAEAGVAGYHLRTDSLEDLAHLIPRIGRGESLCSPRIATMLLRRLSTLASRRQPVEKGLALTAREDQILRLLDMGLSNQAIASHLCIAVHTVKNHVHSLLTKLDARTRAEAVVRFRAMNNPDVPLAN